jgi:hypothetical protein
LRGLQGIDIRQGDSVTGDDDVQAAVEYLGASRDPVKGRHPIPEGVNFMASQPERITSLETTAKIARLVPLPLISIVIGRGVYITANAIAIKEQLAAGGNTNV